MGGLDNMRSPRVSPASDGGGRSVFTSAEAANEKIDPGKPPWSTGATVGQIVIGGGRRCVLDESKVAGSL